MPDLDLNDQEVARRSKLDKLRAAGVNPYPERFRSTHELRAAALLPDDSGGVSVAGRVTAFRRMGKMTFLRLSDIEGTIQLAVKQDELGEAGYEAFHATVDIGDFLGAEGTIFTTRTGEKTLRVRTYEFLGKALKPLPEKFHGLTDIEARYRNRHLDLIMSEDARSRFIFRQTLITRIRRFLEDRGFMEVETPILQTKPSGALARPFATHHNALDIDVYLRIAPETYLKRLVAGGYTKVFEFARCFRNEGISQTHLQDFTMLECYRAYWNYEDNMAFCQELIVQVMQELFGGLTVKVGDAEIDFGGEWPVVSFRQLLIADAALDIDDYTSGQDLLAAIRAKGIALDHDAPEKLGKGALVDLLYKRVSRPKLVSPTFVVEHPIELSPLARANDGRPELTDRFQLLVAGAEIINGYSELVDPVEQMSRLEDQASLAAKGDDEAMVKDRDYVSVMESGMPPISGWGMGIDRLAQVLLNTENIKDVVLFPLLRPQS